MYTNILKCVTDKAGAELSLENGQAAIAHYKSVNGKFEVKNIGVKDSVLTIIIDDI